MSTSVSLTLRPALMLSCGPLMAADARPAQHPNIIIMLTDNLGWGEIGIQGSARGVPTPRLDRLAGQGMRLTNFHPALQFIRHACAPAALDARRRAAGLLLDPKFLRRASAAFR